MIYGISCVINDAIRYNQYSAGGLLRNKFVATDERGFSVLFCNNVLKMNTL